MLTKSKQTAKCLRYMDLRKACDVAFGAFMLSWIVTRHVFYVMMLYSCIFSSPKLLPLQPGQDGSEWFGYRSPMTLILVGLLCILQLIICIWFVMIAKVAYKVIAGQEAEDSRSDVESDEEDSLSREDERKSTEKKGVLEATPAPTTDVSCGDSGRSTSQWERRPVRRNQR